MIKEFLVPDGSKKIVIEERNGCVLFWNYSKTRYGGWRKMGYSLLPTNILGKIIAHLTPLALDGGDSAALQALSTPEVLSTLPSESTPARRK